MTLGLKYYAELRSRHKQQFWRVEIHERGYAGGSEEMTFCADTPISITWEKRGDEFFVPVKASEASINVMCFANFHYLCLFTSDPRKFRVSIYRNTKLYWRGYVVADLYSESFTAPPYSVTIKAVDGFNLLSSIPFVNLDGTQLSGKKSLWEMLSMCFEVLELSVDIADWMDLYAEGMNENQSPLRQVFVEMERFYAVYETPTYRDVLELSLRPFAAQVFQSNGALHIRRLVSLYNATRPMSFYSVGSEFPSGWLVTANGQDVVTASGDFILTNTTRERIESLWEEAINLSGESTLEIVPPVRNVSVSVRNRALQNILPQMGFFATTAGERLLANWTDPYEHLALTGENSLFLYGNRSGMERGDIIAFKGFPVEQCNYTLKWEFTLNGGSSRERSSSSGTQGVEIEVAYAMKLIGTDNKTYYLLENGSWTTEAGWLGDKLNTTTDANKKFEIVGFPATGSLVIQIKQTLEAYYYGRGGFSDSCTFENMSLTIDTGDLYDNALKQEMLVDRGNNVDLTIALPICDIPNIPNERLIFSLYLVNGSNEPTRIWHSKGKNDYNTLLNHLVDCTLRYKQRPGRKVSGEMFTGKHIDMNSVLQDDKYLLAGFYLNSIELNALDDTYTSELVEMPNLLQTVFPPIGDDCILIKSLPLLRKAFQLDHLLILQTTTGTVLCFDSYSGYLTELMTVPQTAVLFPADSAFVIVDSHIATVVDYRGIKFKSAQLYYTTSRAPISNIYYQPFASFMAKYIYAFQLKTANTYSIFRPDYAYQQRSDRTAVGQLSYTPIEGTILDLVKSFSAIGINTSQRAYLHDVRCHTENRCDTLEANSEIKTLSDYFMGYNTASEFKIYRRDRIDFSGRTLVKTISGKVQFAAHTLSEVAYSQNNQVKVWSYRDNTTRMVINAAGGTTPIRGLFYLRGELYIVRENAIYKHISPP